MKTTLGWAIAAFNPGAPETQFYVGLVSIIIGLVALAVSIWLYFISRQIKTLSYEIVSNASIVNVNRDLGDKIKVTLVDDGHEIGEARLLVLKLTNTGNATIEVDDFPTDAPFRVRFAFQPHAVLRCGVQKIEPSNNIDPTALNTLLTIGQQHEHVELVPLQILPKMSITLKILTRAATAMNVFGNIRGGQIVMARPLQRWSFRRTLITGIGLFAAGILISTSFTPLAKLVSGECVWDSIIVGGSSAFLRSMRQAAQAYEQACPVASVRVLPESSGGGLEKLHTDSVQLTSAELPRSAAEALLGRSLEAHPLGIVRFVVIVHSDVTGFDSLTSAEIRDIYAAKISNWSALHGPNEPIRTVGRASISSGTRSAFERHVLGTQLRLRADIEKDTTDEVARAVQDTPGTIGYVDLKTALAYVANSKLKIILIDGEAASPENIKQDRYKFWAIEYMYTKPKPPALVRSFVQYVQARFAHDDGYIRYDAVDTVVRSKHE